MTRHSFPLSSLFPYSLEGVEDQLTDTEGGNEKVRGSILGGQSE